MLISIARTLALILIGNAENRDQPDDLIDIHPQSVEVPAQRATLTDLAGYLPRLGRARAMAGPLSLGYEP